MEVIQEVVWNWKKINTKGNYDLISLAELFDVF